jgi:hypothetical protein
MTAVACTCAEIDGVEGPLSEALIAELDEEDLTLLLLRRFRHSLAKGHDLWEALLCAAGYPEATAAAIALSLDEKPALLH